MTITTVWWYIVYIYIKLLYARSFSLLCCKSNPLPQHFVFFGTVRTQAGNLHEGDTNKRNTWRRVNETTGWSKQETDSRVRLFHGSGLWKKLSEMDLKSFILQMMKQTGALNTLKHLSALIFKLSNHSPICMGRCGNGVGVRTHVDRSASLPARNRDIHYLALQTIPLSGFSVLFLTPLHARSMDSAQLLWFSCEGSGF